MHNITLMTGGKTVVLQAESGTLLSDLLRQAVPRFALPCAGNHTCG